MTKSFHLTVARVGENLFVGEAVSVTLPGSEGVLTVLAHHEALVSPLKAGTISITTSEGKKQEILLTDTGLVEISNNQVTVLV
jgi:F-type H+-transporting ATPase subunit epsilon